MLSISGIFSVTFSVVFAFVADVTTDEDRSAAYGLVSIVCISVCLHPCSMSQATDGGSCTECGLVSIVCISVCLHPCSMSQATDSCTECGLVLFVLLSPYYTYTTLLHVTSH